MRIIISFHLFGEEDIFIEEKAVGFWFSEIEPFLAGEKSVFFL
jgi:hypothetical protein